MPMTVVGVIKEIFIGATAYKDAGESVEARA